MVPRMILPFRRERLHELSVRDQLDELAQARSETPEERLGLALELADLTRELAEAAAAPWLDSPSNDLADKARSYLGALHAAAGKGR
jgi:hypothetical protein